MEKMDTNVIKSDLKEMIGFLDNCYKMFEVDDKNNKEMVEAQKYYQTGFSQIRHFLAMQLSAIDFEMKEL